MGVCVDIRLQLCSVADKMRDGSEMSQSNSEQRSVEPASERGIRRGDQLAVGLLAKDDTAVLKNVLAARDAGLDVFVAKPRGQSPTVAQAADAVGANVVELETKDVSAPVLKDHFNVLASAHELSGVIVATESTRHIDIERSLQAAADDSFVTEAVTKAEVDTTEILVGIPAYNEVTTIADVVGEAQAHADHVLVVDDASQDETAQEAEDAGATVLQHDENAGYGGALRTVFTEAADRNTTHLVILDGDGQHDPSDIPDVVATQEKTDADIVIGSRFEKESETDLPLYRRFGLAVVNTLTNISLGVVRRKSWVRDTQSGFRAYNSQAIESLSQDDSIGVGMSASTDILYHAHQNSYEIEEVGTTVDYDVEDPSSHSPLSHGLTLVSNILNTIERERPMTILGIPGFISSFVGLGLGYWTFSNYINTGTFPLGMATTSGFFGLAGIFACFTAIILHSLDTHFDE